MNNDLKVSVGVIGLDADVNNEIAKIENQIPIALGVVGSEMINDLKNYIYNDFYNKYSPVAYRRRYEKGLLNPENIDAEVYGKKTLHFTYTPKGEPQGTLKDSYNWDESLEKYLQSVNKTGDTPFFPKARNGDALIVWGQKSHEIGKYIIPARPFWNKFVEEQQNGKIIQTFTRSMRPYNVVVEGGEKDLEFGPSESMLASD